MTMALQRPMLPLPTAEALSIPGETGGCETVVIRWFDSPFRKMDPKVTNVQSRKLSSENYRLVFWFIIAGLILPAVIYGFTISHKYQGSLLTAQYSMVYVESCRCSIHLSRKSTFYSETVVKLQTSWMNFHPETMGFQSIQFDLCLFS